MSSNTYRILGEMPQLLNDLIKHLLLYPLLFQSNTIMKQKNTLLLLVLWLALLPVSLFAQKAKGIFNLKEGDWFEMRVKYNKQNKLFGWLDEGDFKREYLLRYQLKKQFENGDQQYDITLKRVKIKVFYKALDSWQGYDSYYPTYLGKAPHLFKEVKTPVLVSIKENQAKVEPLPDKPNSMELSQVSPKRNFFPGTNYWKEYITNSEIGLITRLIVDPIKKVSTGELTAAFDTKVGFQSTGLVKTKICDINNTPIRYLTDIKTNVPAFIDLNSGSSIVLTAASFKLPPNALIKGRIENLSKKDEASIFLGNELTTVDLRHDDPDPESISLPVNLKSINTRFINLKNEQFTILMKPGDTVIITGDGKDLVNTIRFSGNVTNDQAFYKEFKEAYLKQDYNSYHQNIQKIKTAKEFEKFEGQNEKAVENLFEKYKGKISAEGLAFSRNEWNFLKAISKLGFLQNNRYLADTTSVYPLKNYPENFFLEIDTLSLTMNNYDYTYNYNYYFKPWYMPYLSAKVQATSSSFEYSFYNDLYLSLVSLKGYAAYKVVFDLINGRLEEDNWQRNLKIEPFYEQFIERCKDPELLDSLKRKWAINESWKPGNPSPLTKLKLLNGKNFDLTQFKGRPFCLMVSGIGSSDLNRSLQHIKQTKPDIPIVVAVVINRWNSGADLDTSLLKLPNVTFVKISKSERQIGSLNSTGLAGNKSFFFDRWFRVVDNNIPLRQSDSTVLDTLFQKAVNAEHYSPQQKAEFKKLTVWGVSTALITAFIGITIYRVQTKKVKKEEAVKRRIKELEVKAIRSQMNPHFVFNALNSIQSLINANQFKEANVYLAKFAVLLRGVLNNSERNFVSLADELESVKLYCELEQLRFNFKLEIETDKEVNPDLTEIPGMIIQPLVENAIVHGLAPKTGAGLLTIKIDKENKLLKIAVSDNGVGLNHRKTDSLSQKGFGLKLVEERLKVLNFDGRNAGLNVFANQDTGTTALILIPETA